MRPRPCDALVAIPLATRELATHGPLEDATLASGSDLTITTVTQKNLVSGSNIVINGVTTGGKFQVSAAGKVLTLAGNITTSGGTVDLSGFALDRLAATA